MKVTSGIDIIKKVFRTVTPQPILRHLHVQHRNYIFRRAMRMFLRDPHGSIINDGNVISDLIYGWANEGWSALEEYISGCFKHAIKCDGPILECGSGLTTILLGVIAQQSGNIVWSLEYNIVWGERVSKYLKKYQITSVRLCVKPLKNYGDFFWYDPPLDLMPERFAMIVCDDPPGDTRGGRYGLLPVMKARLKPGAVILLDDAARESEKAITSRWVSEFNSSYEIFGCKKPYIKIIVPDAADHQ